MITWPKYDDDDNILLNSSVMEGIAWLYSTWIWKRIFDDDDEEDDDDDERSNIILQICKSG